MSKVDTITTLGMDLPLPNTPTTVDEIDSVRGTGATVEMAVTTLKQVHAARLRAKLAEKLEEISGVAREHETLPRTRGEGTIIKYTESESAYFSRVKEMVESGALTIEVTFDDETDPVTISDLDQLEPIFVKVANDTPMDLSIQRSGDSLPRAGKEGKAFYESVKTSGQLGLALEKILASPYLPSDYKWRELLSVETDDEDLEKVVADAYATIKREAAKAALAI